MAQADDKDVEGLRGAESFEFPHPRWTVGLVLVLAILTLILGLLVRPLYLLIGSPFILVLALWLAVRIFFRRDA